MTHSFTMHWVGTMLSDTERFVPPCSWEQCKGWFNLRGTSLRRYVKHARQQLASSLHMPIILPRQMDHACFILIQPEGGLSIDKLVGAWVTTILWNKNEKMLVNWSESGLVLDSTGRVGVRIQQVNGFPVLFQLIHGGQKRQWNQQRREVCKGWQITGVNLELLFWKPTEHLATQ